MYKTDASLPIGMTQPDQTDAEAGAVRGVHLHIGPEPHKLCRRLFAMLGATMAQTSVAVTIARDELGDCDLIFVEAFGAVTPEIQAGLQWVRLVSKAPLIVLVDTHRPEQAVLAFKAGADAVIPITTARDVIAVRCMALLRRWHGAASIPNRVAVHSPPATLT